MTPGVSKSINYWYMITSEASKELRVLIRRDEGIGAMKSSSR